MPLELLGLHSYTTSYLGINKKTLSQRSKLQTETSQSVTADNSVLVGLQWISFHACVHWTLPSPSLNERPTLNVSSPCSKDYRKCSQTSLFLEGYKGRPRWYLLFCYKSKEWSSTCKVDLPNGHLESCELTRAKTENYHPMVSSFPAGIYLEVEEAAVIVTFLETLLHEISCEVLMRSLGQGVGICADWTYQCSTGSWN